MNGRNMRHCLRLLGLFFVCWMFCTGANAQDKVWQDMHKVKRGETLFGIAKEYNITIQQLIDANPEMKKEGYELKKGEWIMVPFALKGDKRKADAGKATLPSAEGKQVSDNKATVKQNTSTVGDNSKESAKAPVSNSIRVGVMLPLHDEDGDGRRMVEYYRGLLLAFNNLRSEGINTDVRAWNVPKDADVRTTLLDANVANLDVIFGPLYTSQVKPLADFCRRHDIKLLIPFSIGGNEVSVNPNVFQIYQNDSTLNAMAVSCFLERYQNSHHPIFIDCNDPTSRVGKFTSTLRHQLDAAKIPYGLTNVNSPLSDFAKHFSSKQPNAIVLNSEKSPQLTQVFHKLDSLTASRPGLAVSLFGYNDWFIYQDYDLAWYFKYNVYIPSTYYYNKVSDRTEALEKLYMSTYGAPMDKNYIPRIAITGYDHGEFFVRGLKKYGRKFNGVGDDTGYKPLQTRLKFKPIKGGGHQNTQFQLIHFKADQTMESLTY